MARAQYTVTTLLCDSSYSHCDTLSRESYNAAKQLLRKEKFVSPRSRVDYLYTEGGVLYRKEHYLATGELQKTNRITSDSSGNWHTDSLVDNQGRVLFVFRRTPTDNPNTYQVEWFYKGDASPSTRQLIQTDTAGNELSNSTCYSAESCVTYRFYYAGNRKLKYELWVLDPTQNSPVLKETEEYYYSTGDQPTGSVRFMEPEHEVTARFRYVVE